jgi:nitroreductase
VDVKAARLEHPIHPLLAERWSPYAFADRAVSDDELGALFEAARWAPSSYNEQPWRYVVARREAPDRFERLLSCLVEGNREWARFAPVIALGVASLALARGGKPNRAAQHDLGLASGNLCVEATARGLRVHQMIGILPERARELYAIPAGFEALTGLAIGYEAPPDALPERLRARDLAARERRPLAEFVFEGSWGVAAAFAGRAGR